MHVGMVDSIHKNGDYITHDFHVISRFHPQDFMCFFRAEPNHLKRFISPHYIVPFQGN